MRAPRGGASENAYPGTPEFMDALRGLLPIVADHEVRTLPAPRRASTHSSHDGTAGCCCSRVHGCAWQHCSGGSRHWSRRGPGGRAAGGLGLGQGCQGPHLLPQPRYPHHAMGRPAHRQAICGPPDGDHISITPCESRGCGCASVSQRQDGCGHAGARQLAARQCCAPSVGVSDDARGSCACRTGYEPATAAAGHDSLHARAEPHSTRQLVHHTAGHVRNREL